MAVLLEVSPCGLLDTERRLKGTHCLHHQCNKRAEKSIISAMSD